MYTIHIHIYILYNSFFSLSCWSYSFSFFLLCFLTRSTSMDPRSHVYTYSTFSPFSLFSLFVEKTQKKKKRNHLITIDANHDRRSHRRRGCVADPPEARFPYVRRRHQEVPHCGAGAGGHHGAARDQRARALAERVELGGEGGLRHLLRRHRRAQVVARPGGGQQGQGARRQRGGRAGGGGDGPQTILLLHLHVGLCARDHGGDRSAEGGGAGRGEVQGVARQARGEVPQDEARRGRARDEAGQEEPGHRRQCEAQGEERQARHGEGERRRGGPQIPAGLPTAATDPLTGAHAACAGHRDVQRPLLHWRREHDGA
ncbi:hypothetical protein STCU_02772 [Strigomonas culicis]|uniref:Uncharacterized protein n=1 Tax=Strigomonas culicis TaxID=28005 RepID=S9VZX1_9TRYP|nr:hypothetical protein STCU_02772 [Strigomonas culicis]|eukprot:EPY32666.1 hypothetical protein STCU_02772 [Strigomonas culicis]